jgi:hypothetical protein
MEQDTLGGFGGAIHPFKAFDVIEHLARSPDCAVHSSMKYRRFSFRKHLLWIALYATYRPK